ncbi:unnamed protein product [Brachionus calyciflorus]|uniref:Transmembrane protein n=1 Tax=Brachionus calyciflorus TaxID=104777 RepID=A0A813V6T9_9BILA|nr:unnamed protein product [Brachionus calyciflorus]
MNDKFREKTIQEKISKGGKSVTLRTLFLAGFGGGILAFYSIEYAQKNEKVAKFAAFVLFPYGALMGQYAISHYKRSYDQPLRKFSLFQGLMGAFTSCMAYNQIRHFLIMQNKKE